MRSSRFSGETMKRNVPPVGIFIGGWGMRLSTITKAALTKIFLPMPIPIGERSKIAGELQQAVSETLIEIVENEEDLKVLQSLESLGILETIPHTCQSIMNVIKKEKYENLEHEVELLMKQKIEKFQRKYSGKLVSSLEKKVLERSFISDSYPALCEVLSEEDDEALLATFWEAWRETSLLAEPLNMLRVFGIDEVHAIIAEDLYDWLNAVYGGHANKPHIIEVFEKKRRDTGGALANAFKAFEKLDLDDDDVVVLMSGDIWFNFFLKPAIDLHMKRQREVDKPICTVILYPVLEKESYRFGVIDSRSSEVDEGLYQIRRFIEKPEPNTPQWEEKLVINGRALINAGITIYSYGIHDEIMEIDRSFGEQKWREADVILTKLAEEGRLYGYNTGVQQAVISEFEGASLYWADIGTVDAYIREITNWGVNLIPLYTIIEGDEKMQRYAKEKGLVW
ncbi:hypothetical protein DRN98_00730 [Methanosarcinales archaeon]|nr:MAG: hypothetical protein DRN98_00730 [Methanosarcinales archaeon]